MVFAFPVNAEVLLMSDTPPLGDNDSLQLVDHDPLRPFFFIPRPALDRGKKRDAGADMEHELMGGGKYFRERF